VLRPHEPLGRQAVHGRQQRAEVIGHVQQADRLGVDAELRPRQDLEQLVQRPVPAGQGGEGVTPPRTGRPGRPAGSRTVPPAGMRYATVHKTRRNGRVVRVESRAVFGGADGQPSAGTSSPQRQNATDRHRTAR
jgi:hypothetical protein